jgi:transcriptional regulator with XRE-family HTH domain
MNLQRLGAVLHERREALGIPRTEIARRVGVTPTYVWLIEGARPRKNGEPSRPTEAVLERWARALGMDDRYTRQILLLAGYGEPERGRDSAHAAVAPTVAMRSEPLRAPMAASGDVSRSVQASTAPSLAPPPEMPSLAAAPMTFAQPRDLQADVLLVQVRELLQLAGRSDREWNELVGLLESFLEWLRFRLER